MAEMWLNFLLHESETIGEASVASKATQQHHKQDEAAGGKTSCHFDNIFHNLSVFIVGSDSRGVSSVSLSSERSISNRVPPPPHHSPPSPHRSYSTSVGHSTVTSFATAASRMPELTGAPSNLLIPASPKKNSGDPTGFKLIPQSPVFSPPRDDEIVVDIQADTRTNIW